MSLGQPCVRLAYRVGTSLERIIIIALYVSVDTAVFQHLRMARLIEGANSFGSFMTSR